jgi:hypothetical protein
VNYEIYLKGDPFTGGPWPDDLEGALLISAFNREDRVRHVFDRLPARHKQWIIHPQYQFAASELPSDGEVIEPGGSDEREFALSYCAKCGHDLSAMPLCVDMTGFIVPELLALIKVFRHRGVQTLDVLYSEPTKYVKGDRTEFATGTDLPVRQVLGYEGVHTPDMDGDVLVIGVGYQHRLIQRVARNKDHARVKAEVFGLPSLQPHMYQESVLSAARAEDYVSPSPGETWFAPAADPFITAQVLSDAIADLRGRQTMTNLYLSPLGPKPMALGFALYHMLELQGEAASLIFPFSGGYAQRASEGVSRTWRYRLEL